MNNREVVEKNTICSFGKNHHSTPDFINLLKSFTNQQNYIKILNSFLLISIVSLLSSCAQIQSNVANTVPPSDPIAILFQNEIAKNEATCRFLNVSPKAKIDAGIIKAEEPWEQEFILECQGAEVEIGETTAQCNSPMQISFIRETNTRFRLRVTITPKVDCHDVKCVVKIPVFKEEDREQLDLQITGKVRI